jgi:hypothetical protein
MKEALSIPGVLNPRPPPLLLLTKGKREKKELIMADVVFMVRAHTIYCVFLWMGLGKNFLLQMRFVSTHKIDFRTAHYLCITNTNHLCVCNAKTQNLFWELSSI